MAERDTFLDEDEVSQNIDDFSARYLHDMKQHDDSLNLLDQFEIL